MVPRKKPSIFEFWLLYLVAGGAAGVTASSIMMGRFNWQFLVGWAVGGTVGYLLVEYVKGRMNREAGKSS